MKQSLWKDLIRYAKTKGRAPLDERQMNTLKDLYIEIAKSSILGFIVFTVVYGYMDMYQMESKFNFMNLAISFIGTLTYYYLIRTCYQQVIGIDVNFEILLVPALFGVPSLFMNAFFAFGYLFYAPAAYFITVAILWPVYFFLAYAGANRVYQKGKVAQEQQLENGEVRFRSRKQIVNYVIVIISIIAIFPIPYDSVFHAGILAATFFVLYIVWYYGFHTPKNEYTLNEEGLSYHKALWNRKGDFIRYEDIAFVEQRDTFNIGYAKDKVLIHCKDDREIMLFPENAYQFCVELENNL